MSPIAAAVRGRAAAIVVLALLAAVPGIATAYPAPPEHRAWTYVFAGFTAAPAATDYDHRTVTLTGELLRRLNSGGPEEAAAGETVELLRSAAVPADDGDSLGTVTTDAQGAFRLDDVPIALPAAPGTVPGPRTVVVRAVLRPGTPEGPGGPGGPGSTASPTPPAQNAEARVEITATPSTARLTVDYQVGAVSAAGRPVTARGTLQRDSGLGPLPVPGADVRVTYRAAGLPLLVEKATTGSDGGFSVTFPAAVAGTVTASVDGPADPYLDVVATGGLSRRIDVPSPTPTPTPTPAAPTPLPAALPVHPMTATTGPPTGPASPAARPAAAPKHVQPADTPNTLAVTGGGTTRIAFLTGGSTLLLAGMLLMVARRRLRTAR